MAQATARSRARKCFFFAFLLLPFSVVLQFRSFVLQGLKRIVLAQAPRDVLRPILFGAGIWAAVRLGHTATAPLAVVFNLVAVVCALAVTSGFLRRATPAQVRSAVAEFRNGEWKEVSLALLLVSGLHLVLERTDILMLGVILDTAQAGVYAVANRIATVIYFGLSSVNAIAAPLIASLYAKRQRRELQSMLRFAARGVLAFTLPLSLVLVIWGRVALGIFGEEFSAGYSVLVILTVGQLVNALAGPVGLLMTMTGHQRRAAGVLMVTALLNVTLNLILIPIYGIAGAAYATAITTMVWNVIMTFFVWTALGVRATAI